MGTSEKQQWKDPGSLAVPASWLHPGLPCLARAWHRIPRGSLSRKREETGISEPPRWWHSVLGKDVGILGQAEGRKHSGTCGVWF